MAFTRPPGLLPSEIGFICGMELITVVPREALERLDLLGVSQRSGALRYLLATEKAHHPRAQ